VVDGPTAPKGKFMVRHGIHNRTLVSRDSTEPTIHASPEAARAAFAKAKKYFARMGYVTWYAYMYDDQGNRTELDRPIPYR